MNSLGGVWIDVDRRYFNDNAGLSPRFGYAKINLQPGYQLLTGGSALDYVRYRHTDSDLFRVTRQQQFVKAMKYQLAHNFSVPKIPKIVGILTKNIEVAAGGGGGVSGKTILSYAFFMWHLPAGHFFQTQIQGLSGYSDLTTSSANIAAAVQDWETPDVDAAPGGDRGRARPEGELKTPPRGETTITVLNGNGVAGAAGEAGTGLSPAGLPRPPAASERDRQRAELRLLPHDRLLEPEGEAVGGGGELGRQAVRARRRRECAADDRSAPERRDAHGGRRAHLPRRVAPAPPVRAPVTREPAHVQSNPYDTSGLLRPLRKKVGFGLMVPTVLDSSSAPDPAKPVRGYLIEGRHHAVRLVFRTGSGAYWGVQETDWPDAPVLSDRSFRHMLGGRAYDFYYNGPKLHMIVLHDKGATYWVVNSLLDNITNETMIAIAKGLKPLKAG